MTRKEMERDLAYIKNHIGTITARRMLTLYEKYMNGSEMYILGAELDGEAIALMRKHIPLKWCSCQTDHKENNQYLRWRPHKSGAIEMLKSRGMFKVATAEEIAELHKCKTLSGTNKGYGFEKALFNYFGVDGWAYDCKPSTEGGDIEIDGKQIQAKYAPKDSLATITSTSKLINEIERRLKEVA